MFKVKVKAEVAESNTQAQRLAQMNFDIERRTDACLYPNLDKESVTPAQLYEGLQVRSSSSAAEICDVMLFCFRFFSRCSKPSMSGASI